MVDKVIAKFWVCDKYIRHNASGSDKKIVNTSNQVFMNPDQGEPFGKYTPSGKIEMTIMSESAAEFFEPGEHYLITFEKAPKAEPKQADPYAGKRETSFA